MKVKVNVKVNVDVKVKVNLNVKVKAKVNVKVSVKVNLRLDVRHHDSVITHGGGCLRDVDVTVALTGLRYRVPMVGSTCPCLGLGIVGKR